MRAPPLASRPDRLETFLSALEGGRVASLQGVRLDAGGWRYSARYDEGPDVPYPKSYFVPPLWVQRAISSGLVRPSTLSLLHEQRVMDFLLPAVMQGKRKAPPVTAEPDDLELGI